jgi:hypothetical protein
MTNPPEALVVEHLRLADTFFALVYYYLQHSVDRMLVVVMLLLHLAADVSAHTCIHDVVRHTVNHTHSSTQTYGHHGRKYVC